MVTINTEESILELTDIGVTLRTLQGYAVVGYQTTARRVWRLRYKDTIVGAVRIRTTGLPVPARALTKQGC